MVSVIFLGIISVVDAATKKIPVLMLIFMGITGIYHVVSQEMSLETLAISIIPGIVILIAAVLSRQQIGYGDAIVIILMGLFVSADIICSSLVMALMLAGVVSVVMVAIKKADRKKQIAFTPFLLIGYGLIGVLQ